MAHAQYPPFYRGDPGVICPLCGYPASVADCVVLFTQDGYTRTICRSATVRTTKPKEAPMSEPLCPDDCCPLPPTLTLTVVEPQPVVISSTMQCAGDTMFAKLRDHLLQCVPLRMTDMELMHAMDAWRFRYDLPPVTPEPA